MKQILISLLFVWGTNACKTASPNGSSGLSSEGVHARFYELQPVEGHLAAYQSQESLNKRLKQANSLNDAFGGNMKPSFFNHGDMTPDEIETAIHNTLNEKSGVQFRRMDKMRDPKTDLRIQFGLINGRSVDEKDLITVKIDRVWNDNTQSFFHTYTINNDGSWLKSDLIKIVKEIFNRELTASNDPSSEEPKPITIKGVHPIQLTN